MPKTVEELEAELATLNTEHAGAKARITELNNESKGHRLNADNARKEAEKAAADAAEAVKSAQTKLDAEAKARADAETAAQQKIKDAETKANEVTTKAQERAVNADLKIAAKDLGAHDAADVLALLDRSKIKLDDNGEIANAAELVAELKAAKPHLFGNGVSSTSSTTQPPPKKTPEAKKVSDMTDDEFSAALKNKGWRK